MNIVWLLGSMLLGAVLLMLLSAVLPNFKVNGIGSALTATLIASVLGYAYLFVVDPLLLPHLPEGRWIPTVVSHAVSSVLLAIGITFAPGIHAGLLSTLAAAVIVPAAESALMSAIVPLLAT